MRVLVIGSGGREHAIARALAQDPAVSALHAAPGNPGIAALADIHHAGPDPAEIAALAGKLAADLVVIGPEAPLVAGAADAVRETGVACFGPGATAAMIEGSKTFAKEVMAEAGIPTAAARTCVTAAETDAALDLFGPPYVVKDDGLAAGKGVLVSTDRTAAQAHARSAGKVVIEEFLDGPEVSLFAVCDGTHAVPLIPAQDFKRARDGDLGPNTGGMGAYTPLPWAPPGLTDEVMATVVQPAVDAMRRRGTPYQGLLYAGLCLTAAGVRVVEFNARFGDPETQVVLDRLGTPLSGLLYAAATGGLAGLDPLRWRAGAAVTVVIAGRGLPGAAGHRGCHQRPGPIRTRAGRVCSAGRHVHRARRRSPVQRRPGAEHRRHRRKYRGRTRRCLRSGGKDPDARRLVARRHRRGRGAGNRHGRRWHAERRRDRVVISRYTLPEMGRVWSDAHKYELWCRVETLVLEANAAAGTVPADSVAPVRAAPPPTPEAVAEVEAVTDHDVIAFLTAWADNTSPRSAAAYVHFGMTSSNLVDTALAVQLTEATDILLAKATPLVAVLRDHALAHRATLRPGRTHGIHAEPDVWGHRVADFAFAAARARDRLRRARDAVAVGKLSGPVGNYSNISPEVEAAVMPALGLRPADVATQVVMRDGIAEWVSALALAATVCEAVALEVRHGQRTEVRELSEPFGKGQKGSSAMPHKKNPIRSERICGLARVVRGYITPVMEGVPLWHERDISHSSVERIALPDAAITVDYLLHLTTGLVRGLVVDARRMRANLDATGGLIYSSAALLELVASGMAREEAYALVQAAAMETWNVGVPFRDALRKEAAARGQSIDEASMDEACRPERYVARLGPVFARLEALS